MDELLNREREPVEHSLIMNDWEVRYQNLTNGPTPRRCPGLASRDSVVQIEVMSLTTWMVGPRHHEERLQFQGHLRKPAITVTRKHLPKRPDNLMGPAVVVQGSSTSWGRRGTSGAAITPISYGANFSQDCSAAIHGGLSFVKGYPAPLRKSFHLGADIPV